MNMIRMSMAIVMSAMLACLAIGQEAPAPPASTPQRILTEEQRQQHSGQRLDRVRETADSMAEDLRSNELFQETGGSRLVEIETVTADINKTNIPPATDYLRKARQDLPKMRPHLDGADTEIAQVIDKLEKLLRKHGAGGSGEIDPLLAELLVIIKKQQDVRAATGEWGKQLLQNTGDLEPQRQEVSRNQNDLTTKIDEWGGKLKKAVEAEQEVFAKERLSKADRVMEEKKPQGLSKQAAAEIDNKKAIVAASNQDKNIEVLKEIAKILMEEDPNNMVDKNAVQDLQNLADQQHALDAQMQADPQQLQVQAQQFQVEQQKLDQALQQLMQQLKMEALQQAHQAMEKAEQQLQQGQMPNNDAAKALDQALADAQKEQGQPEEHQPGQPEQTAEIGPPMPHPVTEPPHGPVIESIESPRLFALSDKVAGENKKGMQRLSTLTPRQRDAVLENYTSRVPEEYRTLVQDYLRALSE